MKGEIYAYYEERRQELLIGIRGGVEYSVSNANYKLIQQKKDHLAKDLRWLLNWAKEEIQVVEYENV